MTTPPTIKAEYLRATAAEAALDARLRKLEGRTTVLTSASTQQALLAALADETAAVVELQTGTYRWPQTIVNVERIRPVVVRPQSGPVVFSGAPGGNQFAFGLGGRAGNVAFEDLAFDGYLVNSTGIVWLGNCHDIRLDRMTVRNSTSVLSSSSSWALYLSTDAGVGPRNITADGWVVDGSNRSLSALTSYHDPNGRAGTFRNWAVSHAGYAAYFNSDATGLTVDGWRISDCGVVGYGGNLSVISVVAQATFRNVVATASGGRNIAAPSTEEGCTWSA